MPKQPAVELVDDVLHLTFPYDPAAVSSVRSLPRARWDAAAKTWKIPHSQPALDGIKKLFPNVVVGERLRQQEGGQAESLMEAEQRKYLPEARNVAITDFEFATPPMVHQKIGFNFMRALDASACFFEQGLGKAKLLIDLATWRFRKGQVRRVLVVLPASVMPQFAEEVAKHGHLDFSSCFLLDGPIAKRIQRCRELLERDDTGFVVTNYEGLALMLAELLRIQGRAQLFQMIALDESTRIKHATAKRSEAAWKLGRTVRYRNIFTGTPITQNGEDVFSQYRFLDDKIFGPYATSFRAQYLIMGGFENRQVVGYRNFKQFLAKVYSVAIRMTKDRCLDLPPKVYERRYARLPRDVSEQYRQFEKECVAEFAGAEITAPLVMTKLMKLSQVTGGFVYEQGPDGKRVATREFDHNPKLDVLEEVLEEAGVRGQDPGTVDGRKKVIVWCRFRQEIDAVRRRLHDAGHVCVSVHGGIPQRERGEAIRAFQEDQHVDVFVGQISTAGFGITLTAASLVVYFSNTYALEDRLQSEDRCHRIGQQRSVTYVDLLAETSDGKKTIDHDVLDVLRGKSAFATQFSLALMASMATRSGRPEVADRLRSPDFLKKHCKNDDTLEDENFE